MLASATDRLLNSPQHVRFAKTLHFDIGNAFASVVFSPPKKSKRCLRAGSYFLLDHSPQVLVKAVARDSLNIATPHCRRHQRDSPRIWARLPALNLTQLFDD